MKWLIEKRAIAGIGTECPDIELTQRGRVKLLLARKGRYSVVQLNKIQDLPYFKGTVDNFRENFKMLC